MLFDMDALNAGRLYGSICRSAVGSDSTVGLLRLEEVVAVVWLGSGVLIKSVAVGKARDSSDAVVGGITVV